MVRVFPRINIPLAAHHGWPWNSSDLVGHHLHPSLPLICRHSHRRHSFDAFYGHSAFGRPFPTLLLDAILIILITRAVRFLLRPLRQPRIVSELIGGLIIGPSLLGQSRRFNYYFFPDIADYLVRNLGVMGFMYFLFITGVKTDILSVGKAPRKHMYIAATGVVVPFVTAVVVGLAMRRRMDECLAKLSSLGGVAAGLAFTSFPVIYTVLKDLNLLNSEVGKLAMSLALLGDAVGINVLVVFEAMKQAEAGGVTAVVWYIISLVVLVAFMLTVVRRALQWVIEKTPEGKPVDQNYIVLTLLGVMVMGFLTDMFGIAIANGPMWLGLLIPDGPPLGATLVERSETIIIDILMPFSFAMVGIHTNVHSIDDEVWQRSAFPVFAMSLVAYAAKFISTIIAALALKTPVRDSLTLAFIMNLRGQIEVLLYLHWIDKKMIGTPGFTVMTVHTVALTAISTPIISLLYDPTRPYMTNKRRTIQHTPPCTELGLVVAVSSHETVAGLISLLDFCYPMVSSPFSIFALRLVELVGRATPVFIDHEEQDEEEDARYKYVGHEDNIQNALRLYQETRQECVKLHAYTALAPRRTMYQDICELALVKQTVFILLPYHKERLDVDVVTELRDTGMKSVNSDVLSHAPCSVGIYYEKGRLSINPLMMSRSPDGDHYRLVVLFLGGADNREALHLADRMTANPDITLTVIRFLSHNHEGDEEREKKLDDGVVTWFWVKNEANERVLYKEVVVKNGAETLAAIQAMNVNDYHMWITGRGEGINPKLVEGLTTWSEENELGVVGDCVAASDFPGEGSVLVVQQQVMRGQMRRVDFLRRKFNFKSLCVSLWT